MKPATYRRLRRNRKVSEKDRAQFVMIWRGDADGRAPGLVRIITDKAGFPREICQSDLDDLLAGDTWKITKGKKYAKLTSYEEQALYNWTGGDAEAEVDRLSEQTRLEQRRYFADKLYWAMKKELRACAPGR